MNIPKYDRGLFSLNNGNDTPTKNSNIIKLASDWRINFALQSGSSSGDIQVPAYSWIEELLNFQLDQSVTLFLGKHLSLNDKKRTISLPNICSWYRRDFNDVNVQIHVENPTTSEMTYSSSKIEKVDSLNDENIICVSGILNLLALHNFALIPPILKKELKPLLYPGDEENEIISEATLGVDGDRKTTVSTTRTSSKLPTLKYHNFSINNDYLVFREDWK